jgi:iron(III) transport system ATP-binding protein
MSELLLVSDARRAYGDRIAVDGATLTVAGRGISCLLGRSGCGKSTLLRLIAGLDPLDGGTIVLGDTMLSAAGWQIPPERRNIGFVFQDYALFPHISVEDNVGFGLRHLAAIERRRIVTGLLERLHLADRMKAWPHQLSGGEQQRVAIARALARAPALMLLDEPFSGLDSHLKQGVRDDLIAAVADSGTCALIVTHDAEEAMIMGDALILMDGGRILQAGTPRDLYHRPASLTAARLLGDVNALPARSENGEIRCAFGAVAGNGARGAMTLLIRPEAFRLSKTGTPARVEDVAYAGATAVLKITRDSARATVRLPSSARVARGDIINLHIDPDYCAAIDPVDAVAE